MSLNDQKVSNIITDVSFLRVWFLTDSLNIELFRRRTIFINLSTKQCEKYEKSK